MLNSVVMVDVINQNLECGMAIGEAVPEGVLFRLGLVLMTALTTLFILFILQAMYGFALDSYQLVTLSQKGESSPRNSP